MPSALPVVELTLRECLERLRGARFGRLAVSGDPFPDVFPVNHLVDGGTIVFRTAGGTKLESLTGDRNVTFEADGYDHTSGEAWSVVVKGQAHEVAQLHDRFDTSALPLTPWHPSPKHHLVRIEPVETTGRRFLAARQQ